MFVFKSNRLTTQEENGFNTNGMDCRLSWNGCRGVSHHIVATPYKSIEVLVVYLVSPFLSRF